MTTSAAAANWILLGLMVLAGYLICCGAVFNLRVLEQALRRPRRRARAATRVHVPAPRPQQPPTAPPLPVAPPAPAQPATSARGPAPFVGRWSPLEDFVDGERARPFNPAPGPRDW